MNAKQKEVEKKEEEGKEGRWGDAEEVEKCLFLLPGNGRRRWRW